MTEVPKHIEVMARGMAKQAGWEARWDHFVKEATAAHAALVEAGYVVIHAETIGRNAYERLVNSGGWTHTPWDELHPDTRKLHTDHATRAMIEAAEKP